MKSKFLIFLVMSLVLFSCTSQEKAKEKETNVEIKMYLLQSVPFSQNLSELEKLGDIDFNIPLQNYEQYKPKTLEKISFKLGSDIADALFCIKAENKEKLLEVTKNLPDYGKSLGVSEEFLKMSAAVKPLIEEENWNEIKKTLEEYQSTITKELYNMESYNFVFLVQFGGWIKSLGNVCEILLHDDFEMGSTAVLNNKTIVNALQYDIKNLDRKYFTEPENLENSIENVAELKEIIFASKKGFYEKEQVEKMRSLSHEIIAQFSK